MNTQQLVVLAEKVCADWADKGKIIEGGWQAMIIVGNLQDAPEAQLREMRKAYMLGAEHLFTSIMTIMDPGAEPTERDCKRMDLIHEELEAYRRTLGN